MKPSNKSPSYLVQNPYSYCFRIRIPKDLQELVRKKEWRYSLKTGSRREAKVKAQLLAGHAHLIFRNLRRGAMEGLSEEQIQELVERHFKNTLEMLEKRFLIDDRNTINPIYDRESLHSYIHTLDLIKDDIFVYLATGDYGTVQDIVDKLLNENGITRVEINSPSYRQLCREILRAQLKEIEVEKKQLQQGAYPSVLDATPNEQPGIDAKQIPSLKQGERISEVVEQYAAEAQINWNDKTRREALASLNLFIEIVGDLPIQRISRRRVAEFKQLLMKLPPNLKKDPKYRGKSISKVLGMDIPKTLSTVTVSKHLSRVASLFDFACKNGIYEGLNPATDMQPQKKRRDDERRAPFSKGDLIKLFHSEDYLEDKHRYPYQFWTPVIALYTGARQNEIAQLYLSDIKQTEDKVWVFDINNDKDKKLKTKSSKRIIPIHHFLLHGLKLRSYVNHLKKKGEERLFPELPKGRDGHGRNVSRWFNQSYKKKCGIVSDDGRMRDFHSFRATFITHLTHRKVNPRMLLEVDGHAPEKDMTSLYADPFPAKQLLEEVILELDYEIDLSHLKKSRFVIQK